MQPYYRCRCFTGKRYAVLCSYSNEIQSAGHAAVAVTLDDEVYMKVQLFAGNNCVEIQ